LSIKDRLRINCAVTLSSKCIMAVLQDFGVGSAPYVSTSHMQASFVPW